MYRWRAVSPIRTLFHFLVCSPFPFLSFVTFFSFSDSFLLSLSFLLFVHFSFSYSSLLSYLFFSSALFFPICLCFPFSVFSSVSALCFSFLLLSCLCSPSSFSYPCVLYSFVSVPISPSPTYVYKLLAHFSLSNIYKLFLHKTPNREQSPQNRPSRVTASSYSLHYFVSLRILASRLLLE